MFGKLSSIPGLSGEAERALLQAFNGLVDEVQRLGKAPRVTQLQTSSVLASEGQIVRIRGGNRVTLPRARAENQGRTVSVMLETDGTLEMRADGGSLVNGAESFSTETVGLYVWESNGSTGWFCSALGSSEADRRGDPGEAGEDGAAGAAGGGGAPGRDGDEDWRQAIDPIPQLLELPGTSGDWIFDGVDDRINFGNVRNFTNLQPFTLSGWFTTATGANDTLWDKQNTGSPFAGYFVEIETGFIRLFLRGTAIGNEIDVRTTAATFADGLEHHVVVSYDGSGSALGVSMTVDGASPALTILSNTLTTSITNTGNLYIAFPSAGSFDGKLRHMAMWNSALSAAQRLEVYGGGSPPNLLALPTAPSPVKWIKLDASDATGASGILDYGTDNVRGTAEGGLAPTSTGSGTVQYGRLRTGTGLTSAATGNVATLDRAALTGFAMAAAGSNATSSAEPIVAWTPSANMSAERVLSDGRGTTINLATTGVIKVDVLVPPGDAPGAGEAGSDFPPILPAPPELTTYVNTTLVGRRQEVDFVQGTGVALTPSVVGGRPTVTIAGTGASAISSVAVNLGATPLWSGSFDITGLSGLTLNQPVMVTCGVDTTIPDESEEQLACSGIATSATTIRVYFESIGGPVAGTRTFYYIR